LRIKTFLSFLFALAFGLLGAALLINNASYINNKIFLSWLHFQSDNQWAFPIFFWAIAGGFLISGIIGRRRTTSSRPIQFNQSETTRKTWIHSPAIRLWLGISVLGASLVFICCFCLCSDPIALEEGERAVFYGDSLFYQGHVYLLSVEDRGEVFNFEVFQCDTSGWFCHVIYDDSRQVDLTVHLGPDRLDAHLQVDAPHHRLVILYEGGDSSDSGKLLCPIPPS